jgi:hypothetical protein
VRTVVIYKIDSIDVLVLGLNHLFKVADGVVRFDEEPGVSE